MKIIWLYLIVLNIIDGILTYIGISLNYIEEANPLMSIVYEQDPFYFLMLKFILSGLLLLLFFSDVPRKQYLFVTSFIGACLYSFVICKHSIWVLWVYNN